MEDCYKFAKYVHSEMLSICIFEDGVDSGSCGAQCKMFSESKMGIKYWLLLPHFSLVMQLSRDY